MIEPKAFVWRGKKTGLWFVDTLIVNAPQGGFRTWRQAFDAAFQVITEERLR